MRLFCGKQGGSICVFLTLILVPVLLFSGIIVDASRLFASKTVVSGAGDLAMNAALAQYDKMLKDSYGLTAMAKDPGSPQEQEALKKMFCESISARYLKHADSDDLSSVIQVSLAENGFEAKGVSSSSLADVNVLRQQIVEYMKFRGPVYIADDIIEKLKKLPFKNVTKQKIYVDTKTDYGQAASELSDPMKKAKEAIDTQAASIGQIQNSDPAGMVAAYQQKSVFWLAAKSLQMYLNEEITANFPPDTPNEISYEMIGNYLDDSVVLTEGASAFPEDTYRKMITLLALDSWIKALELQPQTGKIITEENGFSSEQINAYNNISKNIKNNIAVMNRSHDQAAKEYQDGIKSLEKNADTIISAGNEAVKQLKKVRDKWKDVKKKRALYDDARTSLINAGESPGEDKEGEKIQINEEQLENQIALLEANTEAAKVYKENIKKLKTIPETLKKQQVSENEGTWLELNPASEAIQGFWTNHNILGDVGVPETSGLQNPQAGLFYQSSLENMKDESADTSEEGKQRKEHQKEAKEREKAANAAKDKILNAVENERNLKKDAEGFPDRFPSGLAKVNASGNTDQSPNTDTSDDNAAVDAAKENMGWLDSLAACLDNLAGNVLEQAYLMEYISEMFNCMTTVPEDQSLSGKSLLDGHVIVNGEIEYILYGNPSTAVNKSIAYSSLYAARLAIDMLYVFMDKEMNTAANTIASAVSSASGQAWLYPIIKYGYLCCSAIAMAAQDTASLTSTDKSTNAVLVWPDKDVCSIRFTYKDYMKLFLLISMMDNSGKNKLVARAGDCIQLNISEELSRKYTMVTLKADVDASTTFLPKVPEFLGQSGSTDNGKRRIKYRSVLAY